MTDSDPFSNSYEPESDASELSGSEDTFSNFYWGEQNDKRIQIGRTSTDLMQNLVEVTEGFPKRVDETLFFESNDHEPIFVDRPQQLMAAIERFCPVQWSKGFDKVPAERFFEFLKQNCERFDAIERYPHFPPRDRVYYCHQDIGLGDGQALDQFVSFFSPLTPHDRRLLKLFLVGLFWGGTPGERPAWLFTGPENDSQSGRGIGKSTYVELASSVCGGFIRVSPNDDFAKTVTRLLSPKSRHLRVARLDNVKTHRFSWSELEEQITSPVLSGHQMYQGEGRRPNLLTWAITLNGASLSRDLAQRCYPVKLARPTHDPGWNRAVREFVDGQRWQIIADIKALYSEGNNNEQ